MKTLYIILLNFNGEEDTIECLESLQKLNNNGFNIKTIVVDNASDKKFEIRDKKFENDTKVLRSEVNLGFSGGNNLGIEYALKNNADYILILNNDTVVDKDLVKELLSVAEGDKNIGVTVPKIYFAKGCEYHKARYKTEELGKVLWYTGGEMDWKNIIGYHRGVDEVDHGQYDTVSETQFATGNCMLIKREVLEKVGVFNDDYFLYYEDSDLNMRVKRAGYRILYVPTAIEWHKNASSTGGAGSILQDYYIARNRMLFGMKYASLRTKAALIRESFKLLRSGRPWQKKGIQDYYLRKFGKGSFGK